MEKSNIVPVHKKESKQNKKIIVQYHICQSLVKCLKRLFMMLCTSTFVTTTLNPNQSGFRPGNSTINQLLAITHKIYCAFESVPSLEARSIFVDFSKAFDRV